MPSRYGDYLEDDGYNYSNEYVTTNDMYFSRSPDSRDRQYPINPGRWSEPPSFKGHRESRNFSYVRDHRGTVIPSVRRPHNLPPLPRGAFRVPPPEPQPLLERQDQWTPPAQRAARNSQQRAEYDELRGFPTQRQQYAEAQLQTQFAQQPGQEQQQPVALQRPQQMQQQQLSQPMQQQQLPQQMQQQQLPQQMQQQHFPQQMQQQQLPLQVQQQLPQEMQHQQMQPSQESQQESRAVYRAYIAPPPPENFPAFRSKFPRKPHFPEWGRIPAAEMTSLMNSTDHPALSRNIKGDRRQGVPPISSEYQATIHKMGGNVVSRHTNSFKSSKELAEEMEAKKRERLQRLEDAAKARAEKQMFKMSKYKNTPPRINSYHSGVAGNPIAERLA